jgi:cell division inhibitor SulA
MLKKLWRTLLTIELERQLGEDARVWQVILSIPGRDGTFARSWTSSSGLPDAYVTEDISMWIAHQVSQAIVMHDGVQGVLPVSGAPNPSDQGGEGPA